MQLSATVLLWIKAVHVIAVIAWMAGLLYLPRLFVYHAGAAPGSELSETFKTMERRLLYAIMGPAMVVSVVFGAVLIAGLGDAAWGEGWLYVKLACVAGLLVLHGLMARWRKDFAADQNRHGAKFYRLANEVPTLLLIIIVSMAVVRPF